MKKVLLITTFVAGTLDIFAAFIQSYLVNDVTPDIVLQYIASGILGNEAFSGGYATMLMGLLIHYFIAFACVVSFFWLYPKIRFLKKSVFLNSVLIGLSAWVATTQIIVPLSSIKSVNFNLTKSLIAIAILVVCIGLPIAYNAKHYFTKKGEG